ncbi:unnamed protein product [Polarella glacialis]|uniref:Uncharacterized protein n=1 Tax=Polarella glacialis TaxID=89957 RepID=A0A813FL90_POLGL|nr:unnamed protein product [Polarella glacialis]
MPGTTGAEAAVLCVSTLPLMSSSPQFCSERSNRAELSFLGSSFTTAVGASGSDTSTSLAAMATLLPRAVQPLSVAISGATAIQSCILAGLSLTAVALPMELACCSNPVIRHQMRERQGNTNRQGILDAFSSLRLSSSTNLQRVTPHLMPNACNPRPQNGMAA